MEEMEDPTESLHEEIQEKAEESLKQKERTWAVVAITTALIAVFAAISSLMAGHYSNEAMIDQIRASDQWAFYQAKGIKAEIQALGVVLGKNDPAEVSRYKKEQDEIKTEADKFQKESAEYLERHVSLSRSVTIFQIAIAISAIAILIKRKFLWYCSIVLALIGIFLFAMGML
jgi:uncharacterized Tic20 family protein